SQRGQVKLTDLGLVKMIGEADVGLTDVGVWVGTPQYMAPEQARSARRADQRCDVYALGTCLYEFLTGRVPFSGEDAQELLLAKEQGWYPAPSRSNPEVPPRLDAILERMLARRPRDRYPSCSELIRDVHALGLAGERLGFDVLEVGGDAGSEPA